MESHQCSTTRWTSPVAAGLTPEDGAASFGSAFLVGALALVALLAAFAFFAGEALLAGAARFGAIK